jgi:hypothetical protein
LFPFKDSCRSSALCLEWQCRLGAHHPYRKVEELLPFFTRGAASVADNTVARHVLAVGQLVDPSWMYKAPEDVRRTLMERATRDSATSRPIMYISSDAHALRRYVDESWAWSWKMINGLRIWCEDKDSGEIIHLGGEFTWGDCEVVGRRVQSLREAGVMPNHSPEWIKVDAQVAFESERDSCGMASHVR